MLSKIFSLRYFETLSRRGMWLEKVHPVVKILIVFIYIIFVAMAGKYELSKLLYLSTIPIAIFWLSDISFKSFASRLVLPAFLACLIGIINPLLDENTIILFGMEISAGWLSFLVLTLKSFMNISMVMLLIISTDLESLYNGFITLKFPKVFAIQFILMIRYISVFIEELDKILLAYSLRANGSRKLDFKVWGSLIGQFFIRSSKKASTLYHCMQLRGFDINTSFSKKIAFKKSDVLILLCSLSIIIFLGVL